MDVLLLTLWVDAFKFSPISSCIQIIIIMIIGYTERFSFQQVAISGTIIYIPVQHSVNCLHCLLLVASHLVNRNQI